MYAENISFIFICYCIIAIMKVERFNRDSCFQFEVDIVLKSLGIILDSIGKKYFIVML